MLIDRIGAIFQDILDSPDLQVTAATSPEDIKDWDSVARLNLVLAIEEAFQVRFSPDEIANLKTVGDFERALGAKGVSC